MVYFRSVGAVLQRMLAVLIHLGQFRLVKEKDIVCYFCIVATVKTVNAFLTKEMLVIFRYVGRVMQHLRILHS